MKKIYVHPTTDTFTILTHQMIATSLYGSELGSRAIDFLDEDESGGLFDDDGDDFLIDDGTISADDFMNL